MAATGLWSVGEDGCLSIGTPIQNIVYHPNLNVILVTSKEPSVQVIDVTSGSVLHKSDLSAINGDRVQLHYIVQRDKIVFCDGNSVGTRKDLNGILLLDTSLQSPVDKTEDVVRVELPLPEAVHLFKALMSLDLPGVVYVEDVLRNLEQEIETVQQKTKGNHKVAKWATVCLKQPHCALKTVSSSMVGELRNLNHNGPALQVASSLNDRMSYLLPSGNPDPIPGGPVDRSLMYGEAARRETFSKWPHMNYKWALPDPMAAAGFYHQPSSSGDDRAMCFTCNVCLVCWEPTDEPWSEHERHSPACPFVKGEYTHNVPMSVTYATDPSQRHGASSEKIECISTSSSEDYVATSTFFGSVVVWNINRQLKKQHEFCVDPWDPVITAKTGQRPVPVTQSRRQTDGTLVACPPQPTSSAAEAGGEEPESSLQVIEVGGAWRHGKVGEIVEIPLNDLEPSVNEGNHWRRPSEDVMVTSLCLVGPPKETATVPQTAGAAAAPNTSGTGSNSSSNNSSVARCRPCLVSGVAIRKSPLSISETQRFSNPDSDSRNEVQALNQVNQALSEEPLMQIISDGCVNGAEPGENSQFVPYLLVHDVETDGKGRKVKDNEKIEMETQTKTITVMSSMQDLFPTDAIEFEDDPDPDVQIVGITPPLQGGTIMETGSLAQSNSENGEVTASVPEEPKKTNNSQVHQGSSPGVKEGKVVQCIELPPPVTGDHYVQSLTPTLDGSYILVNVAPKCLNEKCAVLSGIPYVSDSEQGCSNTEKASQNGATSSGNSNSNQNHACGGCLLLYKVNTNSNMVLLEEEAIRSCYFSTLGESVTSVIILPRDLASGEDDEYSQVWYGGRAQENCDEAVTGQIAVTTHSGDIRVLSLKDFSVLACIERQGDVKFSSLAYCCGIDRLCASTSTGDLRFYHIKPKELLEDKDITAENGSPAKGDTAAQREDDPMNTHDNDLLVKQPLTTEVLAAIQQLTQFENLMPRFTATVPQCWQEIQQEQQQRRHPQHLQQQGEAMQHTRTWRLQQDSTSWDEHLFELVLPKPCSVGHVDLKFSLHPMCTRPPNVQVTLLKQNIANINRSVATEVDSRVDFHLPGKSSKLDQVPEMSTLGETGESNKFTLDPEFLGKHSAEILCGPLDIANFVDLSGHSGVVTFTSPLLLKIKSRSLLVHIKALSTGQGKNDSKTSKEATSSTSTSTPLTAAPPKNIEDALSEMYGYKPLDNDVTAFKAQATSKSRSKQKMEDVKGCDWLHELSVTIRRSRKTPILKDRLQRVALLEQSGFHDQLLMISCGQDSQTQAGVCLHHRQSLALDILCWVISVQLNDPNKSTDGHGIVNTVQSNLKGLIKACFIEGGRTVAHKCAKLIALCLEYSKTVDEADVVLAFSFALVQALLDSLPLVPTADSAGAVHWYFTLLNRVKCLDVNRTAQGCVELLTLISRQYYERKNPLHSLLRARYGLYGTPLDPELFDMEPPQISKLGSSQSASYASILNTTTSNNNNQGGGASAGASQGYDEPDFRDLLNLSGCEKGSTKTSVDSLSNCVHGLLEVEPLHFTSHSTSDGLRVENLDAGSTGTAVGTVTPTMSGTINFHNGITGGTNPTEQGTVGLSSAMASAEQQLHILQLKQLKLLKLQQQKMKLEQKLAETSKNVAAAAATINSLPTVSYSYSSELCPPTPKTTPLFMTPPMTPPSEVMFLDADGKPVLSKNNKGNKGEPARSSIPLVASQTLLQPPPPQVLVVERMHSGARRFVVLDFGKPVLLTDVIIPACADLASLSVDTWVHSEEVDGQRLLVAADIAMRSLVLSDLQPPPICRYLKITTVGRYSGGTTRSKIPIGSFYGHSFILPWEMDSVGLGPLGSRPGENGSGFSQVDQSHMLSQLSLLMTLQEDIQCRYSLAQHRLQTLLNSVEVPACSSMHTQYFLRQDNKEEDKKVNHAYHDCIQLQIQLNLAQRAIKRLQQALGIGLLDVESVACANTMMAVKQASSDKLRCLMEHIVDTLLSMTYLTPSNPQPPLSLYRSFTPQLVETLFKSCCISGTRQMQVHAGMLMLRTCGHLNWWGDFVAQILQEFFSSEQPEIFPQHRVFLLLTVFGQKALTGSSSSSILQSVLAVLAKLLVPLTHHQHGYPRSGTGLDLSLISWFLLFISKSLDSFHAHEEAPKGAGKDGGGGASGGGGGSRWDFMHGENTLQTSKTVTKSTNSRLYRLYHRKLQKRLMHTKQQLLDLQQAKKNFISSQMEKGAAAVSKETETLLKQQEILFKKQLKQYTSKHFKDIMQMRRTDAEVLKKMPRESGHSLDTEGMDTDFDGLPVLPREKCIPVVKGLTALLLSMDFTCNVDLFIVACKVLARVANVARPTICLPEIMSQQELEQLVLLTCSIEVNYGNISWGGAWAGHAITCLLLDILEARSLCTSPSSTLDKEVSGEEDMTVSMTETDDTLAKSVSLPPMFDELPPSDSTVDTSSVLVMEDLESSLEDNYEESKSGKAVGIPPPVGSGSFGHIWSHTSGNSLFSGGKSAFEVIDKKLKTSNNWKTKLSSYSSSSKSVAGPSGVSAAMDARLELGLDTLPELRLKMMQSLETEVIQQALVAAMPPEVEVSTVSQHVASGEEETTDQQPQSFTQPLQQHVSTTEMLTTCFNHMFVQLQLQRVNLDNLLTLWLTLNEEGPSEESSNTSHSFNPSCVPSIPLSHVSVTSLLQALVWAVHVPARTWVLAFQTLTLLMNLKVSDGQGEGQKKWLATIVIADNNLMGMLIKFLSGVSSAGPVLGSSQTSQAGPPSVTAFYDFLGRLQMRCTEESSDHLKTLLLKLVYTLSAERGAFHDGLGPLDAQCRFLDFMLEQVYERVDINNAISVIQSVVQLVHHHIESQDRVSCRSPGEGSISARSCFGGLFASILRGGDSKSMTGDSNRDILMCHLLRLVNVLIQVPLPNTNQPGASAGSVPEPAVTVTQAADVLLGQNSMTDASKLSQGLASSSQNMPDEEKCSETDEQKQEHLEAAAAAASADASISQPLQPAVRLPMLANLILSHQPIMRCLLQTLSRCNSNTMAMIIGSSGLQNSMQDSFNVIDPLSVGDTVFQILSTLNSKATSVDKMLKPLFEYISMGLQGPSTAGISRVSEPLLWFVLRVLNDEEALKSFLEMGGVQVVCRNLVHSNRRVINTNPSMISTMMQFLSFERATAPPAKKTSTDTDNPEGLHNFAPLGTVTSSSPTAGPADVLIQASPPHRRARSAAWSYHFYPEEAWVDLTITLPCAILLKEVHIQPHLTSLATCPAAASLEISHDGTLSFPVCQPMSTSGLTLIKLQLHKPEVASTVTVRLHKPRDSTTIGLSQILVMGHAAFNDRFTLSASRIFMPTEDYVSRTSIGWLRLLHHCLTHVQNMQKEVAAAAATVPNLLVTCTALLVAPAYVVYASNIENVLLKIGLHSVDMGLNLIENMLRYPCIVTDNTELPFHGKVNGLANESTIDILYQLGITQDDGTSERMKALLEWLGDSARVSLQRLGHQGDDGYRTLPRTGSPDLPHPAPAHVHCIAAILWHSQELPVTYDLQALVTKELFSSVFEWAMVLPIDSVLKKAVDYILCAICYVCPEYFPLLLEWMGVILTMDLTNASVSDDHKDVGQQRHLLERQQMMTDDSKEAGVQNNVLTGAGRSQPIAPPEINHVIPDEPHLSTLATVCQSPVALKQLLDSNFPAVLCQGLFEFCTRELAQHSDTLACLEMYTDASKSNISTPRSPRSRSRNDSVDSAQSQSAERGLMMTADLVAPVLQFLAEVCKECEMKQWLGGPEGNIFWHVLLTLLCNTTPRATLWPSLMPVKHRTLTREQRANIEDAAIEFFTNVIACHQENQQLFASVLCDVVRGHGSIEHGASTPLSGFTRRLFLQVLLEDEKVLVSFRSSSQLYKIHNNGLGRNLHHPKFGSGHKYRTLTVGLQSTCGEVLGKVSDTPSLTSQILENRDDKKVEERKDTGELGLEVVDQLSASAGLQAKEKRNKNNTPPPPRPPSRMGRRSSVSATMHIPVLTLYHQLLPGQPLPAELTLSQLFVLLHERGFPVGQASLDFTMRLRAKTLPSGKVEKKVKSDHDSLKETEWIDFEAAEAGMEPIAEEMLLETPPSPSALQVFASIGGLALLAEHLPLLYPEIARQSSGPLSQPTKDSTSSPSDGLGQEWSVIMEAGEDLMYEEVPEPVMYGNQQSQARSSGTVLPTVPPHSLVAFGLFLRLPGYAEVLLKERKRAQCLLRLVLGVTDDGDGGFILTSPVAGALPTLPFSVLKTLYDSTPLTTDDGVLLRRMSLEVGVLHLVLACLSVLSHHAPRSQIPGHHQEIILAASQAASALASGSSSSSQKANEEKTQNYWAKGTGFGTGSTTSSWDAEQALLRQKAEEEHVTCLLQVIASFINPGGLISRESLSSDVTEKNNLPPLLSELLSQSCLVPAMASYLRNDSVLDMARHVPLYRSLLELLRGIAFCPLLVPLLLPLDKDEDASSAICSLLDKMKGCVDTYSSRLKTNKNNTKSTQKRVSSSKSRQEEEESEGLALLIPDIQQTATLVQESVSRLRSRAENRQKEDGQMDAQGAAKNDHSYEEQYMALMKELQFDTFEFVTDDEAGLRFTMPHHYESYIKSAGEVNNASRARRLAQEAVTLSTSLPLSASSSVFVRCDEERLDVMKVLITGPAETPYANGCFEFDVYFPQDYPNSPPLVNLETTGNHTVRFNPNLYNDGKVCLSVLNTWHGRPEEKWNAQTSSFLQVLVSIQSLILVSEPYFNEPGYERSRGTPSGTASSREYDANIRQASVKWAMLEMLKNPPLCFKEMIHKHFWLKRHEIIGQINSWIADLHNHSNDKRTGRTVAHSCMALKRHFHQLKEELNKMKAPEELGGEETSDSSNSSEDSQCLNELGKTLACDGELAAGTDTSESQQTPPPPPVDEDGALSECNTFSGQHFNGDQVLPAIEMVPPEHNNNVDISEFVDLL